MKLFVRLMVLLTVVSTASAQFTEGRLWVGPSLGYSLPGGAFGPGLQGEYAIHKNIGIGVDLGYYMLKEEEVTDLPSPFKDIVLTNRYNWISALAFGTYHLMPGEQIDPYVKVGLGYRSVDFSMERNGTSVEMPNGFEETVASGFDYLIQAGARYHFSDGLSARAAVGYPVIFSLGFDLATGGPKRASDEGDTVRKKKRSDEYSLWIGPYIAGKASLKTEVAEGWKTGVVFNLPPDYGVSLLVPFGKHSNIGFALDLGQANYGYQFRPENDNRDSVTIIARYKYINVYPHFNLGGFTLGLNVGFPNGASTRTVRDSAASVVGTYVTSNGNTTFIPGGPDGIGPVPLMATMIEARVGGAIPVVTTDFGRLDVVINAGFSLNGLFEDFKNYEGSYPINPNDPVNRPRMNPEESLNPHIVSLSLGMCYRFRLGF